ncbi:MAG: hypothetical protein U1F41_05400 [Burkholderiales bacterium]
MRQPLCLTIAGRGYRVSDAGVLSAMGVASGYAAVLVLALFIDSESVHQRYSQAQWLWLLCPAMVFWISSLWIRTLRGEVGEDSILFALRDRASWVILVFMAGAWTVAQLR